MRWDSTRAPQTAPRGWPDRSSSPWPCLQESTLDLTLPGLRDLRGAVTDEQKRRHQEAQRLGERLQEPGEGGFRQRTVEKMNTERCLLVFIRLIGLQSEVCLCVVLLCLVFWGRWVSR